MKLTSKQNKNRKAGVTLLELTVVILVLLTLIGILFIGVNAWRRGSDRAANVLNMRNVQQAMRGHQNTRNLNPGAAFVSAPSPGLVDYMTIPVPSAGLIAAGGVYNWAGVITQYCTVGGGGVVPPANLYMIDAGGVAVPAPGAAATAYTLAAADCIDW
jgi:type II secretory pathway pseudopilin PulG